MKGFGGSVWGWMGERGVMGEARVRAKLGRDGQLPPSSSSSSEGACCCSVVIVVRAAAEGEGMTRWRVGASRRPPRVRALRNSCAVTRSPEALMRPEEKTTPESRSAKTRGEG